MIETFFTWLNHLTEQGHGPAFLGAFLWGIGSIILSPCHLASIPLVVAYVNRGNALNTKRAFWLSCLFSLGIFLSILGIGLITACLGRMLGDIGPWGKYIIAAVFILFGLVLLEVISLPWSGANMANNAGTGAWGGCGAGVDLRCRGRTVYLCVHGANPGDCP